MYKAPFQSLRFICVLDGWRGVKAPLLPLFPLNSVFKDTKRGANEGNERERWRERGNEQPMRGYLWLNRHGNEQP
jgi:hypothetical protein